MKIDAAKFKAGQETALVDARRGVANGPVKGDDPSWAAGYHAALVDFRETFGDDWRARMKQ